MGPATSPHGAEEGTLSFVFKHPGLIIDAFGELRDQQEQVREDMEVPFFLLISTPHGFLKPETGLLFRAIPKQNYENFPCLLSRFLCTKLPALGTNALCATPSNAWHTAASYLMLEGAAASARKVAWIKAY